MLKMDDRAAKLALARKKLKDHQEKKQNNVTLLLETNSRTEEDCFMQPSSEDCKTDFIVHTQVEGKNKDNVECKTDDVVTKNTVPELNATEILISSKRILEQQVNSLQAKLGDLEHQFSSLAQNYTEACQKNTYLETELKTLQNEYRLLTEQLEMRDISIKQHSDLNSSLSNDNISLQEQLEFTKSILSAKEAEMSQLKNTLSNVERELEASQLQLQVLGSGTQLQHPQDNSSSLKQENEILTQKVSHLEQQLKIQIKDYQQLNSHYEHYVGELNDQLKDVMGKNEVMCRDIQSLTNREHSLVEQISDMEIRLQNSKRVEPTKQETCNVMDCPEFKEMQDQYSKLQQNWEELNTKFTELEKLYVESTSEVQKLTQALEVYSKDSSDNISLLKLNADNTSDKIAAQRATEQNKKLKQDIQRLEDAFVKMTKDKLELTEKITAEKFLNRELTIKLAEIDEKANDLQTKLNAKDEEMMRLQTSHRILEQKYQEMAEHLKQLNGKPDSDENYGDVDEHHQEQENNIYTTEQTDSSNIKLIVDTNDNEDTDSKCQIDTNTIPKNDAMLKLQERFLKIMDEVADLSDEKHRLEHIITQLQNETDTICEYVALYQQQRCLLKKRDEERSAQMKTFQSECARLQSQLAELTAILTRFAEDTQLATYFQNETKHEDILKVMKLLSKLKTNSLIDPQKSIKFDDCYPCGCCSGQLIEV